MKRVKGQEKVGSPFRFHKPKVFPSLLLQTQTASCNYGSLCPSVSTRLSVLLAEALLSLFSIPIVENKDSFALQVESFSFNKCLLVGLAEIHHHWTPPAIRCVSFRFLLLWLLLNHSCFWQPYTHFAVLHYICLWISLKTYKHFFGSPSCFCILSGEGRRKFRHVRWSSNLKSSEHLDWVIRSMWMEREGKRSWWPRFLVCAGLRNRWWVWFIMLVPRACRTPRWRYRVVSLL